MALQRPALLAKLQPVTPWRCGRERAGEAASVLASDAWFSSISEAMEKLGWGADWSDEGSAAVRLSSLLPFKGDLFFAPVPETARRGGHYRRLRMETVRFAPFPAVAEMAAGKLEESRWILDLASRCLLPADRAGAGGPFRRLERARAAVDRIHGSACQAVAGEGLEFAAGAGAWTLFVFAGPEAAELWSPRLEAAVRMAADDGIGGWRSSGWGRSRRPRMQSGQTDALLRELGWEAPAQPADDWWLLGLYSPAAGDAVDWSQGAYRTLVRRGWTPAGRQHPGQRMVREGSVLRCAGEPAGCLRTAGAGFAAGLALPWAEGPSE